MTRFPNYPFDPAAMAAEMQASFAKFMPEMPDLSAASTPADLMAAQQKNLDAFMAANTAAAEAYQEFFAKQVSVFQETMREAQEQMSEFDPTDPAASQKVVETALSNMTRLAEEAQTANTKAYKAVEAQIRESVTDLMRKS